MKCQIKVIGLYIIYHVLLDSGAVRLRGLIYKYLFDLICISFPSRECPNDIWIWHSIAWYLRPFISSLFMCILLLYQVHSGLCATTLMLLFLCLPMDGRIGWNPQFQVNTSNVRKSIWNWRVQFYQVTCRKTCRSQYKKPNQNHCSLC